MITREEIQLASGTRLDAIGIELGNYKRVQMWHASDTPGVIHPEPDASFRAHLIVMFDMERQ